jgi:hypothetical protein
MIKANELRIGNLVEINGRTIIMDARTFHAVIHEFPGYKPNGIALTEEWLVKLGFELKDDKCFFGSFYEMCYDDRKEECIVSAKDSRYGVAVYYVHQLQNLYFALTGEELMITKKPAEPEDPIWTEVYGKMDPQERSTYQNYLYFKHYDVANKLKERMIEKYFGK